MSKPSRACDIAAYACKKRTHVQCLMGSLPGAPLSSTKHRLCPEFSRFESRACQPRTGRRNRPQVYLEDHLILLPYPPLSFPEIVSIAYEKTPPGDTKWGVMLDAVTVFSPRLQDVLDALHWPYRLGPSDAKIQGKQESSETTLPGISRERRGFGSPFETQSPEEMELKVQQFNRFVGRGRRGDS